MRVLIASHMYPHPKNPNLGIFVHEQVKALQRLGIKPLVVTGSGYGTSLCGYAFSTQKSPRLEEFDGVPVCRFAWIQMGLFVRYRFLGHTYSSTCDALIKVLAQHGYSGFDVIHAHTSYLDGLLGLKWSQKTGTPLLITEHTVPFKNITKIKSVKRNVEHVFNQAQKILVVSQFLKNKILESFPEMSQTRLQVVPNSVDTQLFCPNPPANQDLSNDPMSPIFEIAWLGTFQAVKQIDILLAAFAAARTVNPNMRLRLITSSPTELFVNLIESMGLQSGVSVVPMQKRHELVEQLKKVQALVISSKYETFGIAAIEAMSMGLPVLTTDCGGPTEIIHAPQLGLVVPNNVQGLTQGMLELCEKYKTYNAELIRQEALAKYDSRSVAQQMSDIYNSILSSTKETRHTLDNMVLN